MKGDADGFSCDQGYLFKVDNEIWKILWQSKQYTSTLPPQIEPYRPANSISY
jgi:hypothetical protein